MTDTRVDRMGKRCSAPIDNMIPQLFRSLPEFEHVENITKNENWDNLDNLYSPKLQICEYFTKNLRP